MILSLEYFRIISRFSSYWVIKSYYYLVYYIKSYFKTLNIYRITIILQTIFFHINYKAFNLIHLELFIKVKLKTTWLPDLLVLRARLFHLYLEIAIKNQMNALNTF